AERRQREVLPDRHPAEQGVQAPLARDVGDVAVGGVDRGPDDHVAAREMTDDLARADVLAPQGLEELVLALTFQAGQPDELPGPHFQLDGPAAGAEPEAADAQDRRPAAGRGGPGLLAADRDQLVGAGHEADELARRPGPAAEAGDRLARAHDRDAVADLLY